MNVRNVAAIAAAVIAIIFPARGEADDRAQERAAFQRCMASRHWCIASVTDRIRLDRIDFAMLRAQTSFTLDYFENNSWISIPCERNVGKLHPGLNTDRPFSYGDIRIEYRVDPSGKIAERTAHHVSGTLFLIDDPDTFLDHLKGATMLTLRARRSGDNASFTTTFDVSGLDEALRKLDCRPRAP